MQCKLGKSSNLTQLSLRYKIESENCFLLWLVLNQIHISLSYVGFFGNAIEIYGDKKLTLGGGHTMHYTDDVA